MSRHVSLIIAFQACSTQETIFGSSETHFKLETFIDRSYKNTWTKSKAHLC